MKKLVSVFMVLMIIIMSVSTVAFASNGDTMVTTGNVNIRANPDINANVIGWLAEGVEISPTNFIYTYDGRIWVQIEYKGKDGYISEKNLDWVYDEDELENVVYNMPIAMVTTGNVNVREWASMDAPVYTYFEKGKQIEAWGFYVSGDGRIWAELELDIGVYGYVSMKYLAPVVEMAEIARFMVVNGGRVNVREIPNIESRDIGTITYGTEVEVEYFIPTDDGRIWASCYDNNTGEYLGFVSCMYLEPIK